MENSFCNTDKYSYRARLQIKRLNMLKYFRDSLERRLSAVNASISTLESQIERDSSVEEAN